MRVGIFPFVVLIAIGLVVLATWAFVRFVRNKSGQRASSRYAVVIIACCTILWLGVSFFFTLWASLGHSGHPVRDALPECAISFLILVGIPSSIVLWRIKRKK